MLKMAINTALVLYFLDTFILFKIEADSLDFVTGVVVKIVDNGLDFYFSLFIFFILFCFSFIFLFLEQLVLGFISHAVTSVTN